MDDELLFDTSSENINEEMDERSSKKKINEDGLFEKLYDIEEEAIRYFGNNCELVIEDNKIHNETTFRIGEMLYCLEMAREYYDELDYWKHFSILYGKDEWKKIGPIYNFESALQEVWNVLCKRKELLDAIIPKKYTHFNTAKINDNNYDILWDELQKIEEKYKNGIDRKYQGYIEDWESELCYEQGKFLEYIHWDGENIYLIPEIDIYNCTYSQMSFEQLRYYLYWRTEFRKGVIVAGYKTFYNLYANELIAELGPFTPEERLSQLDLLRKHYEVEGLYISGYIRDYKDIHHFVIDENGIKTIEHSDEKRIPDMYKNVMEIRAGRCGDLFEYMCRQAAWKYKRNDFIRKTKCLVDIKGIVSLLLPKLNILFAEAGLEFMDFLVGRVQMVPVIPYTSSVWTERVVRKFVPVEAIHKEYTNVCTTSKAYMTDKTGSRRISTMQNNIEYNDPYLSEYILQYIEMIFRKNLRYKFSEPEKLEGALKRKCEKGYEYYLAADINIKRDEKKYCSLYDDIERLICETMEEYFTLHPERRKTVKWES